MGKEGRGAKRRVGERGTRELYFSVLSNLEIAWLISSFPFIGSRCSRCGTIIKVVSGKAEFSRFSDFYFCDK